MCVDISARGAALFFGYVNVTHLHKAKEKNRTTKANFIVSTLF